MHPVEVKEKTPYMVVDFSIDYTALLPAGVTIAQLDGSILAYRDDGVASDLGISSPSVDGTGKKVSWRTSIGTLFKTYELRIRTNLSDGQKWELTRYIKIVENLSLEAH